MILSWSRQNFCTLAIVCVFLVLLLQSLADQSVKLVTYRSEMYQVRVGMSKSAEEAVLRQLHTLRLEAQQIALHLRTTAENDVDDAMARRLETRLRYIIFGQRSPAKDGNHVGVTINKSFKLRLCMPDPDGRLLDGTAMRFVMIHELAHVASESIGHNAEFDQNNETILQAAETLGFYTRQQGKPVTYCGSSFRLLS